MISWLASKMHLLAIGLQGACNALAKGLQQVCKDNIPACKRLEVALYLLAKCQCLLPATSKATSKQRNYSPRVATLVSRFYCTFLKSHCSKFPTGDSLYEGEILLVDMCTQALLFLCREFSTVRWKTLPLLSTWKIRRTLRAAWKSDWPP